MISRSLGGERISQCAHPSRHTPATHKSCHPRCAFMTRHRIRRSSHFLQRAQFPPPAKSITYALFAFLMQEVFPLTLILSTTCALFRKNTGGVPPKAKPRRNHARKTLCVRRLDAVFTVATRRQHPPFARPTKRNARADFSPGVQFHLQLYQPNPPPLTSGCAPPSHPSSQSSPPAAPRCSPAGSPASQ